MINRAVRSASAAVLATVSLAAAPAAFAQGYINVQGNVTVQAPVYQQPRVYVQPRTVYVQQPRTVYVQQPRTVYVQQARPVYYQQRGVYYQQPVMVATVQPRVAHQGIVSILQGGGGLGVVGPASVGTYGGFGGAAILSGGYELSFGGSVRAEIGYRALGISGFSDSDFANGSRPDMHQGDLFVGLGARYSILPEMAFHPFVEAFIDYHAMWIFTNDSGRAAARGQGLGGALAVGGELDVSANFSLEIGLRFDYVFNASLWNNFFSDSRWSPSATRTSGSDGTLWLLLGASFSR